MNEIIIPGKPIPKRRPRFCRNRNIVYFDQVQEAEETSFLIRQQWKNKPKLQGPLKISISFFMEIPKYLTQPKRKRMHGKYHYIKPDIDNLIKMVLDCMTISGNIFEDDRQIAIIESEKIWSLDSYTKICIEPIVETGEQNEEKTNSTITKEKTKSKYFKKN